MNRTETVRLTNMCLIEDPKTGKVVVQDRPKERYRWHGLAFPGGHVEKGEDFHDAVVREVLEETGLIIHNPRLVGIKHWHASDEHYLVLLYKTSEFSGEIRSSEEGQVYWVDKQDLTEENTAFDLLKILQVMEDESLSEFYYPNRPDGDYQALLK